MKRIVLLLISSLICGCNHSSTRHLQKHPWTHTTVCGENSLETQSPERFRGLGDTIEITAELSSYQIEGDGDYHLFLSGRTDCMILAEVMPGTRAAKQFDSLRSSWKSPEKSSGANWQSKKISVAGLRYYDRGHFNYPNDKEEESDVAYHIEIHPVLGLSVSGKE